MYTAIGAGAVAYLAIGCLLLVRSWQSARRRVFPPGSPLEPVVIVVWPVLPSLWWRRRKSRDRDRPRTELPLPPESADEPDGT